MTAMLLPGNQASSASEPSVAPYEPKDRRSPPQRDPEQPPTASTPRSPRPPPAAPRPYRRVPGRYVAPVAIPRSLGGASRRRAGGQPWKVSPDGLGPGCTNVAGGVGVRWAGGELVGDEAAGGCNCHQVACPCRQPTGWTGHGHHLLGSGSVRLAPLTRY